MDRRHFLQAALATIAASCSAGEAVSKYATLSDDEVLTKFKDTFWSDEGFTDAAQTMQDALKKLDYSKESFLNVLFQLRDFYSQINRYSRNCNIQISELDIINELVTRVEKKVSAAQKDNAVKPELKDVSSRIFDKIKELKVLASLPNSAAKKER